MSPSGTPVAWPQLTSDYVIETRKLVDLERSRLEREQQQAAEAEEQARRAGLICRPLVNTTHVNPPYATILTLTNTTVRYLEDIEVRIFDPDDIGFDRIQWAPGQLTDDPSTGLPVMFTLSVIGARGARLPYGWGAGSAGRAPDRRNADLDR